MSLSDDHVEDIKIDDTPYTARIYRDTDSECPYEAWDCFSTYAHIGDRSDKLGDGWDELPTDCIDDEDDENYGDYVYSQDIEGLREFCQRKDVIAIPYKVGYYGEVNRSYADDAHGFVFATSAMIEKEYGDLSQQSCQRALILLQGEFNTFQAWGSGDVYGYKIVLTEDLEEDDDPDEIEEGSCWGFYGDNYSESGLLDAVGEVVGKDLTPATVKVRENLTKVPIASGCSSCLAWCMKRVLDAAKQAAKTRERAAALQPA